MTGGRVVAQGTFDLLHPGHLHYLRAAAEHGDELHVVIGRRRSVDHKAEPVLPDRQRRDVVAALDVVDRAHLGHPRDVFAPIVEIDPDVIVLGHDQHHDAAAVADAAADRGVDCEVVRASAREPRYAGELLSSGEIVERVLAARGGGDAKPDHG